MRRRRPTGKTWEASEEEGGSSDFAQSTPLKYGSVKLEGAHLLAQERESVRRVFLKPCNGNLFSQPRDHFGVIIPLVGFFHHIVGKHLIKGGSQSKQVSADPVTSRPFALAVARAKRKPCSVPPLGHSGQNSR